MASATDYFENRIINDLLRTGTKYLGLYTVAPTDAGGGTEVSGPGYTRQVITFSADSPTANTNTITFPVATGSWGTAVYFGVFDAVSGGNLWLYFPLSAQTLINIGDQFVVAIGAITTAAD